MEAIEIKIDKEALLLQYFMENGSRIKKKLDKKKKKENSRKRERRTVYISNLIFYL